MKYTIMGFSQKAACEFNLDLIDLVILRWFVDLRTLAICAVLLLMRKNIIGSFTKRLWKISALCLSEKAPSIKG